MVTDKPTPLGRVKLNNVRLAFPHLLEAESSTEDSKPKFSAEFLMEPGTPHGDKNIAACEKAIIEVKKAEWGDKWDKVKIKDDRVCFRDGSEVTNQEGEPYAGFDGMMALKTGRPERQKRPKLKSRSRQDLTDSEAADLLYGGAYVNAIVTFYAISDLKRGGNGVFCIVEGVQFFEHGEPFGNAGISDDEFDEYEDDDGGDFID